MKNVPEKVEVGGHVYLLGRLDLFEALDMSRRAAPVLPVIFHEVLSKVALEVLNDKSDSDTASHEDRIDALGRLIYMSEPAFQAIAAMPKDDFMTIVKTALSCIERNTGKAWVRVMSTDGALMFNDLTQQDVMDLTIRVLARELRPTIAALLSLGGAASNVRKETSESSQAASTT